MDNSFFNYQSLADFANTNGLGLSDEDKKKGIITGTMTLGGQNGTFNGNFDTQQIVDQIQKYQQNAGMTNYASNMPTMAQTTQPVTSMPASVTPVGTSPIAEQFQQNIQTSLPAGNQLYQLPTNNEVGNYPQLQQPMDVPHPVQQPEKPSNIMSAFLYASQPQPEPMPQPMAPQEAFNNYQQTIFGQQSEQSNINPVIEQPAQNNMNPQDMFNNYQQQVFGSPAPVAPTQPYSTEQTTPNGYYSSSNPMSMDVVWHPTDGGRYQFGTGPDNVPFYQYQQQNPETGEYGMFDGSRFMPGTGIGY